MECNADSRPRNNSARSTRNISMEMYRVRFCGGYGASTSLRHDGGVPVTLAWAYAKERCEDDRRVGKDGLK
jgi:hypothetical protein